MKRCGGAEVEVRQIELEGEALMGRYARKHSVRCCSNEDRVRGHLPLESRVARVRDAFRETPSTSTFGSLVLDKLPNLINCTATDHCLLLVCLEDL